MSAGLHRKQKPSLARRVGGWFAGLVAVEPSPLAWNPALDVTAWPSSMPALSAAPAPALKAPATITHADVPPSVADIDPERAPAELPASTTRAADAVEALHAAHLSVPRGLRWTYHDDGAQLHLDVVDGDDGYLRGVVAVYAAALGTQVEESQRAENGFVLLSTAGEYAGVRIGVQAVVSPDVDESMDRIYRAFRAEDDTQRIPVVETGPRALPAPQGAA